MPTINWKEEYSVGVEKIDKQHQRLISLINKLYSLYAEEKFDQTDVDSIFQELTDYADEHFKTEERYFDLFNYDKKDQHIEIHNKYRQKVEEFKDSYKNNNNSETLFAISNFLNDWWIWHINNTDKEYVELFHENGLE